MKYELAQKIKEVRVNLNMSQERFGKKVGLSAKTISAYENGKIMPSYKILETISHEYGITMVSDSRKKLIDKKIKELEMVLNDVKRLIY